MATKQECSRLAGQLSTLGAVKKAFDRTLPSDSPPASITVLAILKQHGEMRLSRLTELLGVDPSVASRHVAHLAANGWTSRRPDPQDKRSRLLCIEPRGEQVLREASLRCTDALADSLRSWSDHDVRLLTELLARLDESLECRRTHTANRTTRPPADQTTTR
ncbi:MarR family winged helix-turn-helix transcriptional regulator [Streptomyces sp. HB2AG]|uniref:MarR family winged helix-turn-helix transcriptional regulator n=1 Tax=Streptomyces sp. HB2AG TaxID=2983400 RepID=UPI0022AB1CCF|nr:MarR family transcriptional regulator [Streptomyces sp. HB2AG]MCZ2525050.1 MarR family transcriptional regulator [Streptomyces sp. HB2AG]